MYYYYGFDMTYIIYVLPAIIFTFIAQIAVKRAYSKMSREYTVKGYTGADIAERILRAAGVSGVSIVPIGGEMTDNFNPKTNTVSLSEGVYNSTSIAAAGIAAHECGHAIQYAMGYGPIKFRNAIIPACNIGSSLSIPLVIAGFIFNFDVLIYAGIAFFALAVLFQLVTLPVEFNASRRAMASLRDGDILASDELPKARRVLTAAAMTYVAALAVSLMQLLRLIVLANRRRD